MAALPAPMSAPSTEELQKALEVNWQRLERAALYLARLAEEYDWGEWAECYERINGLLDERLALRRASR